MYYISQQPINRFSVYILRRHLPSAIRQRGNIERIEGVSPEGMWVTIGRTEKGTTISVCFGQITKYAIISRKTKKHKGNTKIIHDVSCCPTGIVRLDLAVDQDCVHEVVDQSWVAVRLR